MNGNHIIYGPTDVARELGVRKSAVANWLSRYDDWPTPDFETRDGRLFWADLQSWRDWFTDHITPMALAKMRNSAK